MEEIAKILAKGYLYFESSSTTTPQWTQFYNKFKSEFSKELKSIGATNIVFSKGHFCISGFFTSKDNRICYFSLGDVRGSQENLMYRSAQSYKDYSGGSNQWVRIAKGMGERM